MTPKEIHIALDLELQEINSFRTKAIKPQEKDWFLNSEVLKFFKTRTNNQSNSKGTGFQDTVKRADDLKAFVKSSKEIVKDDEGESYIDFPPYYLNYISSSLYMKRNCLDERIRDSAYSTYINKADLNLNNEFSKGYKISININGKVTDLFNLSDLPVNYISKSLNYVNQDFIIIEAIKVIVAKNIKTKVQTPLSLYWENESSISDIVLVVSSKTKDITVTVTSGKIMMVHTASEEVSQAVSLSQHPIKKPLRLIDFEFYQECLNSSLSGSTIDSPVATLKNDRLYFVVPNNVIGDWVEINYFLQPTPINLLLNSNVDLSRSVMLEIISNTVRYIKAIIKDDNYQVYAQENLITE